MSCMGGQQAVSRVFQHEGLFRLCAGPAAGFQKDIRSRLAVRYVFAALDDGKYEATPAFSSRKRICDSGDDDATAQRLPRPFA